MTRRNDKRNNRRNSRQRNNNPELPPFASMLFEAILGKGVDMIAKKMSENAEEENTDIHAEGISNQDVTNINNGKANLTKCIIPTDGTAVELPVPDNLQVFISEDGKPMVRKKIEGDEKPTNDAEEGNPITYDDICKELFLNKSIYWIGNVNINQERPQYNNINNCTSKGQARRLIAFNKLQNIAKYLNKGWKPNFKDVTQKWFITEKYSGEYQAKFTYSGNCGNVFFKNEDLTNEAIRLMGEDSLNDLFSTDW